MNDNEVKQAALEAIKVMIVRGWGKRKADAADRILKRKWNDAGKEMADRYAADLIFKRPAVSVAAMSVLGALFNDDEIRDPLVALLDVQRISGKEVEIKSTTSGQWVATHKGSIIPADICSLGAGRDAWLRKVRFPCQDCGAMIPAGDWGNNSKMCEPCMEIFSEENREN